MTTPIEHQRRGINSSGGWCHGRRLAPVILAAAAGIAGLALFGATPHGEDGNTVASGPMRLVDQATDSPAPPPPGGPPPGVLLAPGVTWPPWTPLQQGPSMVLPGGPALPPLPQGVALSPELQQEISQMYLQAQQMLAAGPPPNVPNEVCRYNTVRVPCPPA
ncbi:hypothetical protein [Mycobacterium bohemicum]|nr:hypothetical protein [Mycobacterium bohemicum]MCV6971330.1 hypothetical protein [Mycobacterium bohemicum]